jgi:hypothetical protein
MATHLRVRIAGSDVDAKVVKAGSPDDVDLSLLSVETARLPMSVQMRRVELCGNLSAIGQAVIIAGPESSTPSKIAAPILLPPNLRSKFLPISPDVGNAGNLGSGVFDAGRKCLLGIMSGNPSDSKNEANGASAEIPKHFVPVSKIRAFIPAWFRF